MSLTLYPSITTDSLQTAQSQLDTLNEAGVEVVHLDVIDGFFADNITVAPLDLAVANFGSLQCDLHLMVDEPMDFVLEAVGVKEQLPIRAVIAHIERMSYQMSYIEEVRQQGWKVGLSLDLATPVEEIDEECWQYLDVIQLLAIDQTGFVGQPFNPLVLEKIEEVQTVLKQLKRKVEVIVDGGVHQEQIEVLKKVGASSLIMNTEIWNSTDPVATIQQVQAELTQ